MSKLARRYRRRRKNPSSPKRNPPLVHDIVQWVAPGFAGFAVTRLLTRAAQAIIARRFPKLSGHAGAIASVSAFLASWFLGQRWGLVAKYHTPVTVGSAIATGQSLLQIYAPNKLGWIVSDAKPAIAASAQQQQMAANAQRALPDHMEEIDDDPRWYTYNDAYDTGRYASSIGKAPPQQQIQATPGNGAAIDDIQDGDEEMAQGIFGN